MTYYRPYNLLGQAIAALDERGVDHVDLQAYGRRIRVDKIEEFRHRDMIEEDLHEIHIR